MEDEAEVAEPSTSDHEANAGSEPSLTALDQDIATLPQRVGPSPSYSSSCLPL